MNAVHFFRGIELLVKYQGERTDNLKKDPEGRVRWKTASVPSEDDLEELKKLGYVKLSDTEYLVDT